MAWSALFQPNPAKRPRLAEPGVRVKAWTKTLLQHRAQLERLVDAELGLVLGCGHWGCVVDMVDTEWVLKLTVDPTEAPIWGKINELIAEERYGADGFTRVRKIFKLTPGIPYGKQGRTRQAYGIVREKVATLLTSGHWSSYTNERVKQAPGSSYDPVKDLNEQLRHLGEYRYAATNYHRFPFASEKERAMDRAEHYIHALSGTFGGALGESLSMLASNGVLLRDVHQNNIGWRIFPEIDGPGHYAHTGLVIFDPGHTPTAPREMPTESWESYGPIT